MPSQSATASYAFATSTALALEAAFDGGRLTSDGGLPWLAEAEGAVGICAALAACVPEWRRQHIHHSIEALVRQRSVSSASPAGTRTRTTRTRCAPIRCSSWSAAAVPRATATWPASPRCPAWRMRWTGMPACAWPMPWSRCTCGSGSAPARPSTSCWTATAPTTPPTGTRKGAPTTPTMISICTIHY